MTFFYRPMHLSDIERVVCLENRLHTTPWSKTQLVESLGLSRYACHIACDHEKVVGYLIASHGVELSDLLTVGVDPDYQRKGIAATLLKRLKMLAQLRKNCAIFLEVRLSNHQAIALYEKLGFLPAGLRKNYYQDKQGEKENAITMIWHFNNQQNHDQKSLT